jgi:hypothetical protein
MEQEDSFIKQATNSTPNELKRFVMPSIGFIKEQLPGGAIERNLRFVPALSRLQQDAISEESTGKGLENIPIFLPSCPNDEVRSQFLANWAEPWVQALREEIFGGSLPPFKTTQEAVNWILEENNSHPVTESQKRRLEKIDKRFRALRTWAREDDPWTFEISSSSYLLPYPGDNGWQRVVPVQAPKLIKLARETKRMEERLGWQQVQAVIFMLTGLIPFVPNVRMNIRDACTNGQHGQDVLWRRWVEIKVNGKHVTMANIKRIFNYLNRNDIVKKRPLRSIDYEIYCFVTERRKRGHTWKQILMEWRESHPQDTKHQSIRGLQKVVEKAQKKEFEIRLQ